MLNLARANLSNDPLNVVINAHVEQACARRHASDRARGYLGASLIGDECLRKIQFEWMVATTTFPARVHSIFARGHFFEAESRQLLVDAGFVFAPPEALSFVAVDGLIAGHADGIIINAPSVSGLCLATPALWEHKGLNAKNYRAIERDGLAKVFPRYAAQVALYQNFLDVRNPALMTITNADTCERLHFTVPFDARRAQEASDRAMQVIEATRVSELLPRLDQSLEDFRCKMLATAKGACAMSSFDAVNPKKPTSLEGRLAQIIRMLCSDREGDIIAAIHAFVRTLKTAGNNRIHTLADRVEKSDGNNEARATLNGAEMQRIYDSAYQKGFADGSDHGRKSAIVAGPSVGTFNIGVNSGVNGYSWQEIARHCAANKHLFHGRDFDFVESIAEQLEFRSTPSPPQAKWLKDLFMRRFNGRID